MTKAAGLGSAALIVDVVRTLSPPALLALLVVLLLVAGEVGHRLGARRQDEGPGDLAAGRFVTGAFVLLALLVATVFSVALARGDACRVAVLDEANALRDAVRLAPLLPDDDGAAIVNDLRRTLDLALGLGVDPAAFDADVAETATVSARMWEHLAVAVAAEPGSLPTSRLSQALMVLDAAVARRTSALRNRLPLAVDASLIGTALAAFAFARHGAATAGAKRRRGAAIVVALLLSCLLTVTLVLQRPETGSDAESLSPLRDIRSLLPPLP